MRKFSSYGPVDKDLHFHVPRTELVRSGIRRLTGEVPEKGGHFITVWAPRQCGKTWIMREVMMEIRERGQFDAAMISMQSAQTVTTDQGILELFAEKLSSWLGRPFPGISAWKELPRLFAPPAVEKPLVLIIDEFDALEEEFINKFANEFRDIYITRQTEMGQTACMLHGLALIGVRGVLGIENVKGSPFNVQRSMHIPNLTRNEVGAMFREYEAESGQPVESGVVDRIHKETRGQPGLVSWFGELLTEGYDGYLPDKTRAVDLEVFDSVFQDAVDALPNNHLLNIISKAKRDPYKSTVLELFKTRQAMPFRFDDPRINFLYLNGVIDREKAEGGGNLVRFASPFVQKRLFNFFSREIFPAVDHLYDPMTDIEAVVGPTEI
ncbi:MAG: ATP-binding protein, partial [Desulfococcaceae bacterium]